MAERALTIDRTITFSLGLAVLVQSASALLWVGAAEARLLALESVVNIKPPVSERLARIEEQMEMTRLSLSRIERQLDDTRTSPRP
jgi:hypothetical protein